MLAEGGMCSGDRHEMVAALHTAEFGAKGTEHHSLQARSAGTPVAVARLGGRALLRGARLFLGVHRSGADDDALAALGRKVALC